MKKRFLLAAAAAALAGCSTVETPAPCSTQHCITQRSQQAIISECVRDLQFYTLHRTRREAIDRKYQYPLTNANTYATLTRMGGVGPSPRDWCEAYAERRTRVVMPGTSSAR